MSNTIDLIDSSDGIDEEEDVTEILRETVDSQPASSHENEQIDNMLVRTLPTKATVAVMENP